MRIGIATDHGGFGLKEALVAELRAAGHETVDYGAPIRRKVVHAFRRGDQPRRALEGSVGRKRQPKRIEVICLARCHASNVTHDRLTLLGPQR